MTRHGILRTARRLAAPAFVAALDPATRGRAFGVAQSGLCPAQGIAILAGGATAQLIGAPLTVSLVGLLGCARRPCWP